MKRLLAILTWVGLLFLALVIAGCVQLHSGSQTVWKSETKVLNETDSTPRVKLMATPTLRPLITSEATVPSQFDQGAISVKGNAEAYTTQSVLLTNDSGEFDYLKGVGRLIGFTACTASYIKTSQKRDAPAYALTAGRCVQPRATNEVFQDSAAGDMRVIFNYFADSQNDQIIVPVKKITYSTMKSRDLAILELEETVGELSDRGIAPLSLGDADDKAELPILMISAPLLGYSPENSYLHLEKCLTERTVDIVEAQFLNFDLYRINCREGFGGSVGAPLLIEGEAQLIGILSTTALVGFQACIQGAPCELGNQSAVTKETASYATSLSGMRNCFSGDGHFNIDLENCSLDVGRRMQLESSLGDITSSWKIDEAGELLPVNWSVNVRGDYAYYRYKSGLVDQTNCRDKEGYSQVFTLDEYTNIELELANSEGIIVLCVIGGSSPSVYDVSAWQSARFPSALLITVDNTPPEMEPIIVLVQHEANNIVSFHFDPPELSQYEYKTGIREEVDCFDSAGYRVGSSDPLIIPKNISPIKFCVVAIDAAGNKSLPYEIMLGGGKNEQ